MNVRVNRGRILKAAAFGYWRHGGCDSTHSRTALSYSCHGLAGTARNSGDAVAVGCRVRGDVAFDGYSRLGRCSDLRLSDGGPEIIADFGPDYLSNHVVNS